MSMMASVDAQNTTPVPCLHLNGQCTGVGEHDIHWGPDNRVASIRPSRTATSLVSAQLCSFEDVDPARSAAAPGLSVAFDHFEGDLTLAEVDQLVAGLRDFANRLQVQAAHLAAAQRLHEVNR